MARLPSLFERRLLFKTNFNVKTLATQVSLSQGLEEKFQEKKLTFRKHPGVIRVKTVSLPPELNEAIKRLTSGEALKKLHSESKDLIQYLHSRKQPVEDDEIKIFSKELSKELEAKRGKISDFPSDQQEIEMNKRKEKIQDHLRYHLYHWQPVDYTYYRGLLYIVGRMAPNYAVLQRVFTEIKHREPNYQPKTLFDFGSGVGTVLWAAHSLWGDSLKEYFAVDTSEDMNSISRLLLQGGEEGKEPFIKRVFQKQFLPTSHMIKFDVVVSAHSLLELPSIEARLQTVDILWRKTQDYLVLIENGSNAGFQAIVEARDFVIEMREQSKKKVSQTEIPTATDFHVFAPCPHDKPCPRLTDGTNTPCNFEVSYFPLKLARNVEPVKELFSFVILKKSSRNADFAWPRVVRPVLLRGQHTVCRMCTSEGMLKECIFTKSKHGKSLYKCARQTQWGDFLPISTEN